MKELAIQALSDAEVPVIFGGVSVLKNLICQDPVSYKNLTPKLVEIFEKVMDHKYPPEYDYHKVPAPWIQIDLLQIL